MAARLPVLLGLLTIAVWSLPAGAAPTSVVNVPYAHVGDQATYANASATAMGFEWLAPETTQDQWAAPRNADILRMVVPAVDPNPFAPQDQWTDVFEAFAAGGGETLSRTSSRSQASEEDAPLLTTPVVTVDPPGAAELKYTSNATRTVFAPTPSLRTCLAHHGLQGQSLAPGGSLSLTALCPGLTKLHIVAEDQPLRAAQVLEREALEVTYTIRAALVEPTDVPLLGAGWTLRFAFADGLPFVAAAEAKDATGATTWSLRLTGFQPGSGDVVPPWASADEGPGRALVGAGDLGPITEQGPADGGTMLPYTLAEASANLLADPTLVGFQRWRAGHPDAFIGVAWYETGSEGPQRRYARWAVHYMEPAQDGSARFMLGSQLTYVEGVPPLTAQTRGVVQNFEADGGVISLLLERPAVGLSFASAMRLVGDHMPPTLRDAELSGLAYQAPGPGRPPLVLVERSIATSSSDASAVSRASVMLDGLTAAARQVELFHRREVYQPLDLEPGMPVSTGRKAVDQSDDDPGPALLGVKGIEFQVVAVSAAAAGAALALGVLAYSRLRRSDVLEHPTRRFIYEFVRTRPGIHLTAIVAALGRGRSSTAFHLSVLERAGLVTAVVLPHYRRYYVSGSVPHGALRTVAELESGQARSIYDAVRAHPGITLTDLARRARLSQPAAHKAVERLRSAGLLEKRAQGREVHFTVRESPGLN